jgi:trigger factor
VVTVPAGRVKSERGKAAKQLSKRVRIPGFRKGKIPLQHLEARYGPDIDRQTQQRVIDLAFREAVKEKELEPISEPMVSKVNYDQDSELTFEVSFDIRPEVKLGRLGGFRVSRPAVELTEDEVDQQLGLLRERQALWKPAERPPVAGDSVEVEITPLGGDEEKQPYAFVLGQGRAIPEVEAAIMTQSPGSTDEFEVGFPDDFEDESKRGTKQRLKIELKQVLEQELPELDDEFAKSVGEFDSLEALSDRIAEDLRQQKEHEVDHQIDRQLIDLIIEANPFEVPDSMIDRYAEALVGEPPEGTDPDLIDKARDEARPAAVWGIKRTLILQRIAEDEGFEATKEEIQERLRGLSKRTGRPVPELRSRLAKSGELRDLERGITEEKVFKYLREQSEIDEGGA